jgi:hypothetical protein
VASLCCRLISLVDWYERDKHIDKPGFSCCEYIVWLYGELLAWLCDTIEDVAEGNGRDVRGSMESIEERLMAEIAELSVELRSRQAALQAFRRVRGSTALEATGNPGTRYVDKRPLVAITEILQERGHGMKQEDLIQAVVDGGGALGKKRGHHNIRISIEISFRIGKLRQVGDSIGMPDWGDERF